MGAAGYLMFLLVAVHGMGDLWLAAVAAIVGDIGSTGYLLIRYRRSVGPLRVSIGSWRSLMRSAWPFGAGSVLAHLSVNFPVLAIAALLGSVDAGIFSGANKLVFFILMVDRILGTMLLPVSARLRQEEGDRLSSALNEALRWIVLIGLPLCIGGAFLAGPIVAFVFGPSYLASGDVFRVLVWYALLTMIHTVYTSGVLATGGEKKYRNVMAVSAGLYITGVVGGVLIGGVMGAAAGMILAEGVTVVLMERATRPDLPTLRLSGFGRIVTAGIVLAVGLFVLPSFHVLITIAIGAAVYGAALFVVQAVTFNELRQLIQRPA
jgi:stage V sporulation protein B